MAMIKSKLEPVEMPLASILPNTEYFEIDSEAAGARYGIWVNSPPAPSGVPKSALPAIFTPDGNIAAPVTMPFNAILPTDPINPVQPFIEVAVGYCGADAADIGRLRNRDLVPPGEPVHPAHLARLDELVQSGFCDRDWAEGYKTLMRNGRADAFYEFLTQELFPLIAARYEIDEAASGFFGDSYGGLFAMYAALRRPRCFSRIGAASPGVLMDQSVVFSMLDAAVKEGHDHTGRSLHLVLAERELTAPGFYQCLGENFARIVAALGTRPLKGLAVSSRIVTHESHVSLFASAWFDFLRTCYPVEAVKTT